MKACTPLTSPEAMPLMGLLYPFGSLTLVDLCRHLQERDNELRFVFYFFCILAKKLRQESLEVSLKQLPTRICRLLFHLFILLFQPLRPPGLLGLGDDLPHPDFYR